jgi:hypothetical protein
LFLQRKEYWKKLSKLQEAEVRLEFGITEKMDACSLRHSCAWDLFGARAKVKEEVQLVPKIQSQIGISTS